jgi:hypothetical protein
MSSHGVQVAVPAAAEGPVVAPPVEVEPEPLGANEGTVHPASTTTIAESSAITRRE